MTTMDESPRMLVTHPGRQHAHQLARALHARGGLAGFWTGVPSAPLSSRGPLFRFLARWSPQPVLDLPADAVRHCYVEPVVRRLARTLCSPPQAAVWQHRAMHWFDRWCARRLPPDLDAVVCYENAALHTFRRARARGVTTVLDAASFHHTRQDTFYEPVEPEAAHARINAHKDEEIALADHVLTVSELARESYVDAGVPPSNVTAVPMGADLSAFRPPDGPREPEPPVTFMFAGHVGRRKGADLLLAASRRLYEDGIEHRVQFAGDAEATMFDDAPPTVAPLGYLSRDALAEAYRRADVLVLPSRHDSFGRVVVEAMATGLPALVSENVGAKAAVTENENGWGVPAEDVGALAERMEWCVRHPTAVSDMQDAAVTAAQDYTWAAYRRRVAEVLGAVLESAPVEDRAQPQPSAP